MLTDHHLHLQAAGSTQFSERSQNYKISLLLGRSLRRIFFCLFATSVTKAAKQMQRHRRQTRLVFHFTHYCPCSEFSFLLL